MKKILFTTVVLLVAIASTSFAQSRFGAGLVYGTEVEAIGLGVHGEFFLSDKVALAPGFNYFFADDPLTWWEINANANYYFTSSGSASVYGLAGLNLATIGVDLPAPFEDSSSTELGLNLGVGANFDINSSVMPYTQLRFVVGDADQVALGFGVKF